MLLFDEETEIMHVHDGLRAASYFTACERGEVDRKRPRYAAAHNFHVTCLWCAIDARRNGWKIG